MMSKTVRLAAAALALTVGFAGAASAAKYKVRYAYGSVSFAYLPMYIAEDGGLMKDEGVDFQVVQVSGSGPAAAATLAGSLNFFVGVPFTAARAIMKGQKLATFAMVMTEYGSNIVVSKGVKDKYKLTAATPIEKRLDVLKGLKIAAWTPSSAPDLLLRFIAAKKGWNPERDFTLLPIGGSGPMLAAMEKKRIDAFSLSSPTADQAVQRYGAFMLYNAAIGEWKPLKGAPYIGLIGNTDWLKDHKNAAVAVYRALWRGMKMLHEEPVKAKALMRKRLHSFDATAFEAGYENNRKAIPTTPEVGQDKVEMMRDFVETLDHKPIGIPLQKLIDADVGKRAAKTMKKG
jgi:NitT/TauT family transport system substrate-binding protein